MNTLQVGFCRMNIDPPLGIAVHGYFLPRYASEILDSLHINVVALSTAESKKTAAQYWNPDTGRYDCTGVSPDCSKAVLMASIDNSGPLEEVMIPFRGYISEKTGVPFENIFLCATHTHTGPAVKHVDEFEADDDVITAYREFLKVRLGDASLTALRDMRPARMGFCVGKAPDRVAYIRRYRMKDGSTMTCPPVGDPGIAGPLGTLDQRVNVIRFDREGADTIVFMNYGLHADCLNLDKISADWPGWMSDTFERAVPGTKVVFFNGCEGDVGSTNVHPQGGDMNDTRISFDNEMKSEGMARFVGRALAGTILQVYDKVEYVEADEVKALTGIVSTPSNMPKPEELTLAHKYKELHDAGRDCDIPYTAMELTTVVAEALRMCELENGPDHFDIELIGVKIGPVAFLGIPGEPFTEIGRQIKQTPGWKCICPTSNTNGSEAYYPMKECFDEGGYEARSSLYVGGVAETIIAGAKDILGKLKDSQYENC